MIIAHSIFRILFFLCADLILRRDLLYILLLVEGGMPEVEKVRKLASTLI